MKLRGTNTPPPIIHIYWERRLLNPRGFCDTTSRLQIVVDSLVNNAVRHNTASLPKVMISANVVADDTVELSVVDNGPGISEAEQRVLTGDEQISPLSHSSGLGLWLVKWLTESYGGSLAIETPNDGGSDVRLRLARADK